jgi:two-component system, OmpR family, response regulator
MNTLPHLLIVDDDKEICALLSRFLAQNGYRISVAHDGKAMMRTLEAARIGLIVLDLMLPGTDGLSLCRHVRANSRVPVIMLTAKGEETDRIIGLEMGADDYLPKPFNPRELLARIRAVLRRAGDPAVGPGVGTARTFEFAGWRLDIVRRQLFSPTNALVERPQRVLNRDQLLDLSRGRVGNVFDRSVDVQISRLRSKIEPDPKEPQLIKTVRSAGYVFAATVAVGGADE